LKVFSNTGKEKIDELIQRFERKAPYYVDEEKACM
tara:strand:+ start:258 stop:362 length:105 start_codon:yes stop_codon:yes gene_type:complete